MADLAKLMGATPDIKYIVGIVQWNGKNRIAGDLPAQPCRACGRRYRNVGNGGPTQRLEAAQPAGVKPRVNGVHSNENMLASFLFR